MYYFDLFFLLYFNQNFEFFVVEEKYNLQGQSSKIPNVLIVLVQPVLYI